MVAGNVADFKEYFEATDKGQSCTVSVPPAERELSQLAAARFVETGQKTFQAALAFAVLRLGTSRGPDANSPLAMRLRLN
jgi:hypothetical protein